MQVAACSSIESAEMCLHSIKNNLKSRNTEALAKIKKNVFKLMSALYRLMQ